MNYGSLTGEELERLVYLGDERAKRFLAEHPEAVRGIAEDHIKEARDAGYDEGRFDLMWDARPYLESLKAAVEKFDDDSEDRANLCALLELLEIWMKRVGP